MKKFRLLTFFIVALVASFILTSNTFAFYKGQVIGKNGGVSDNSKDKFKNAWLDKWKKKKNYTTHYYYVNYGKKKLALYCVDKHHSSGVPNAKLAVKRVLDNSNPKDAVILYIISNTKYTYWERVMAVRAFAQFIPSDFGKIRNQSQCANVNSGVLWANGSDVKKYTAEILGLKNVTIKNLLALRGKKTCNVKKSGSYIYPRMKEKNSTVKKVKKLFKEALKYGYQVSTGEITFEQKEIEFSAVPDWSQEVKQYTVEEKGVQKAVGTVDFSITFKKFNDATKDAVTVRAYIPDASKKKITGVSTEYQVAGTDTWTSFTSKDDFKPLLDKENVLINFRITLKTDVSNLTKGLTFDFNVDVDYKDTTVLTGAFLYNKDVSYPKSQRFYVYDSDSSQHAPISKPLTWDDDVVECTNNVPNKNNVDEYKDYMNKCCRGHNNSGFNITEACNKAIGNKTGEERQKVLDTDEYCKLKVEYCDLCNTDIDVPKTCSEFSEGEFENNQKATISGPTDIKVCVMDGYDESNMPYKLTKFLTVDGDSNYTFADNQYCSVSCKEDYNFELPAGRYTISGRYFTLKMDSVATKTCYTDMINYEAFEKDRKDLEDKLSKYISSGNLDVTNTEFVNLYNEYNKAIKDIKACSLGWDNKYDVDPKITFDYDEEYIDQLLGGKRLNFVRAAYTTNESKWFCNGSDVNRAYDSCIGGTPSETAQTTSISAIECSIVNATKYECNTVTKEIPKNKYAKITTTVNAEYTPESVFYTKYSTGVVEVNKDGNDLSKNKKYTKLESYLDSKIPETDKIRTGELPVSLKDGKGVYNYNIKFRGVGEFFSTDGFGRLIGSKESVSLTSKDVTFKGTYVCAYVINCPECTVACVEDPTKGIFCQLDDPTPDPDCPTCASDGNVGELFSIHQISLTNFNPNDRTLGANLSNEKGQALISSITSSEKGENIYKEPEYSFVFTPAAIAFLRDVNENSSNGYIGEPSSDKNLDMYCQNYSDIVAVTDEKKAAEIRAQDRDYTVCQSGILNELTKSDQYGNVVVKPLEDSRQKIESWLDSEYCQKNACTIVGAIGPAWK